MPAKRYIFSESIKVFQEKNTIDKIIFDRIDNQIDTYISYIEEKDMKKNLVENLLKYLLMPCHQ